MPSSTLSCCVGVSSSPIVDRSVQPFRSVEREQKELAYCVFAYGGETTREPSMGPANFGVFSEFAWGEPANKDLLVNCLIRRVYVGKHQARRTVNGQRPTCTRGCCRTGDCA
jgi:hypothetical protein